MTKTEEGKKKIQRISSFLSFSPSAVLTARMLVAGFALFVLCILDCALEFFFLPFREQRFQFRSREFQDSFFHTSTHHQLDDVDSTLLTDPMDAVDRLRGESRIQGRLHEVHCAGGSH